MSELEKARSNRHWEIDYNKLIEELRVSYSACAKSMEESDRTGVKPREKDLLEPTVNTLCALNCFLNSIGFDGRELPLAVAGVGTLLELLSNYLDSEEKAVAYMIRMRIAPSITSANVSFMKPRKPDDA